MMWAPSLRVLLYPLMTVAHRGRLHKPDAHDGPPSVLRGVILHLQRITFDRGRQVKGADSFELFSTVGALLPQ